MLGKFPVTGSVKNHYVWRETCTTRNGEMGFSKLMVLEICTGICKSRARRLSSGSAVSSYTTVTDPNAVTTSCILFLSDFGEACFMGGCAGCAFTVRALA